MTASRKSIGLAFWCVVRGKHSLPIYIFPARLSDAGFRYLVEREHPDTATRAFWSNLQEGYALFEQHHRLLDVHVAKDGKYEFADEIPSSNAR